MSAYIDPPQLKNLYIIDDELPGCLKALKKMNLGLVARRDVRKIITFSFSFK